MSLEIVCEQSDHKYRHGDTISGRIRWNLEDIPKEIVLRLFYYTEGKGTQDIGVVAEHRVGAPTMSGEDAFSFKAPGQPSSCAGKLVSIRWALELIAGKNDLVPRVDVIISPTGEELQLGTADA